MTLFTANNMAGFHSFLEVLHIAPAIAESPRNDISLHVSQSYTRAVRHATLALFRLD